MFSGITPGITRRAHNVINSKFSMRAALIWGQVHAVVRCGVELKISFTDASHLHQVPEQTSFEGLIPVNRDGQPDIAPRFSINVMTPLHA